MRHRIYVDEIAPLVTVSGEEFHHSVRVVRIRVGEEVELFDREGKMARATVEALERDRAIVKVEEAIPSRESPLAIHLAMAVIQLEKFELVLQKATELGVRSFIPLVTDRVEIRPERYRGKGERWEKIIFEAVKQSGRAVIPAIEGPAPFEDVVRRPGTKVFFDADLPAGTAPPSVTELTVFIGPEGGWSEAEIAMAQDAQCVIQRLGPRRLRAETAAIAGLAIIAARYGDI